MSEVYLCRVGRHSQIGRFRPTHSAGCARGQAVVLRTARGVEIGEVLSLVSQPVELGKKVDTAHADSTDGKILRRVTLEDQLLQQQLQQAANMAFDSCQRYLREIDSRDCLLEVEPLLDGKTLYFHFIGNPEAAVAEHLESLAEIFRETIQASRFAKLLEEGCGPGCGTEEKGGCGDSGTCAVCVVARACKR